MRIESTEERNERALDYIRRRRLEKQKANDKQNRKRQLIALIVFTSALFIMLVVLIIKTTP